ncbi:putative caspase [Xylaria curta]|nr:putative caspase [Xylaria curta]
MEDLNSTPTHFALLIGVNSDSERPLEGCVRDVREITKYLKKSLTKVHIQLFTAENDNPTARPEDTGVPELLATCSNVKSGFERILSSAKRGTYVYIHYSGHGVRMEASSEYSSRTTGDLALNILEDSGGNDTRPFLGLELAHILKRMVTNGVTVTLVLDCCFSGSVLRKNRSVRYREYNPKVYDLLPSFLGDHETGMKDTESSNDDGYRNASMLPNWLVNPEGYTVITACGPHEIAMELQFPGQTYKHGALSYFILRAMEKLGGLGGKHAHIYPYLCSMFRQYRPTQNPMWYGNPDLCFFGENTLSTELTGAPFAVIWNGPHLKLQGGQAHGICEGDQFAVYTFGTGRPLVIGKVNNVRSLTSDMDVQDPEIIRGKRGCIAKALTRLSLRKYPIELIFGPTCPEDWRDAMGKRENLIFEDKKYPFAFHIAPDENGNAFLIRDNSGRETACSPSNLGAESMTIGPIQVLDTAEHLAKFELVKDLTNNSDELPFGGKYRVALIHPIWRELKMESTVDVQEGDKLRLVVENHGETPLYVHVYNLAPLGQIQNILKASYAVIPPRHLQDGFRGEWSHYVKAAVPKALSQKGMSSCEDIIKVFITSQPTSFASLELPKLGDSHDHRVFKPTGQEQGVSSEREDWVAIDFRIRTHKDKVAQIS